MIGAAVTVIRTRLPPPTLCAIKSAVLFVRRSALNIRCLQRNGTRQRTEIKHRSIICPGQENPFGLNARYAARSISALFTIYANGNPKPVIRVKSLNLHRCSIH